MAFLLSLAFLKVFPASLILVMISRMLAKLSLSFQKSFAPPSKSGKSTGLCGKFSSVTSVSNKLKSILSSRSCPIKKMNVYEISYWLFRIAHQTFALLTCIAINCNLLNYCNKLQYFNRILAY